jgi:hypothetical protein
MSSKSECSWTTNLGLDMEVKTFSRIVITMVFSREE